MNSLDIYKLKQKIDAYVKDERFNMNIMTNNPKINCKLWCVEFEKIK
jgi:hypothetical protein